MAAGGLTTNVLVFTVAAMLVSPIMGPILGMVMGYRVADFALFRMSFMNEFKMALVTYLVGCFYGVLLGDVGKTSDSHHDVAAHAVVRHGDDLGGVRRHGRDADVLRARISRGRRQGVSRGPVQVEDADDGRIKHDVAADHLLGEADLEAPADSFAWRLRREQDAAFASVYA